MRKENWPEMRHFRHKLDIVKDSTKRSQTCRIKNKLVRRQEHFPSLVNIAMKLIKQQGNVFKKSFSLLINGTPVNGFPFHLVHAKNACNQVWLPTAINRNTLSKSISTTRRILITKFYQKIPFLTLQSAFLAAMTLNRPTFC